MPPVQDECLRCGTCCAKGGPGLHTEDIPLFATFRGVSAPLDTGCLQTLRKGEPAWDQPAGEVRALTEEMVKLRPSSENEQACLFFQAEDKSCGIYANRPLECRVLACWSPEALTTIYDKGRLKRTDILPLGSAALELAMVHERQCSYDLLAHAIEQALQSPGEEHEAAVLEILSRDASWREAFTRRLQACAPASRNDMTMFLFGRPMRMSLSFYGLRLVKEGNTPRLARIPQRR